MQVKNYNSHKPLLPGKQEMVAMVSENNMAAPRWDMSIWVREAETDLEAQAVSTEKVLEDL